VVILLSERKNKCENEIIKILKKYGADHISDKHILKTGGKFTLLSIYKKTEISLNKGIAVFIGENHRLKHQILPIGIIGICEENNLTALENFKYNNSAVITCGINNRNTITFSSISDSVLLATIQRSFIDISGNVISPCELKIYLSEKYSPFAVMVAVAVLLLKGIVPQEF
jgi:hypothetical protein